ncbi:ribosome maturation factor RimM [Halocynthiibacter namhaensis]|uniref:ribosome maturation factor RimM n=1 Tax=Halocynthiibacter namhaensis TaxID=1290553 RepID=UPI00057971A2|nr:ribosome maturation factor RimM [Halocynthiibacter namhaensis]
MNKDVDQICVGAIGGSFGVRGEVRLKSFCADPEAIMDYLPLIAENSGQSFLITLTGNTKNGFTARLSGVETKEEADALRGVRLMADRARLPSLPNDEYYYSDLIGLEVRDTGGTYLGTVKDVRNHGASDILEVQTQAVETVLLPFTEAAVPTVDLASGRIIADPPDGIFA